jgi:hypothetical protein
LHQLIHFLDLVSPFLLDLDLDLLAFPSFFALVSFAFLSLLVDLDLPLDLDFDSLPLDFPLDLDFDSLPLDLDPLFLLDFFFPSAPFLVDFFLVDLGLPLALGEALGGFSGPYFAVHSANASLY